MSENTPAASPAASNVEGLVPAFTRAAEEVFPSAVRDLKELVAIPSIAWEGMDPAQLQASAQAVAALVAPLGFDDVQILSAPIDPANADGKQGAPAVVARKQAAEGKPTVLLYAHHDVQPVGEQSLWDTAPFEATEIGERLYGRGAADDKAGIIAHLSAIKIAQDILGEDFGLGITLFFEGEEEAGSPSFRSFLEKYRKELEADVIVVADSGNWKIGVPALTTSLRGLVDGYVDVQVLDHAVHSGMFGGPVLDSLTLAARLISTFHDEAGNVAVDGLVSAEESPLEYPESDLRQDASVLDGVELAGEGTLSSRLWSKPALSVIGMDATATPVASNTISPRTRFKISLRLAPGQEPQAAMDALAAHVSKNAPFGAKVTFTPGEQGNAFVTDTDAPAAQSALWALGQAWGTDAVTTGIGGSIPFIADLVEIYPNAQILITGVEDPDSRAHSANESLHLGEFVKVIAAEGLMLASLNATDKATLTA